MSRIATAPILSRVAIAATVFVLLGSAYDAIRTAAIAEPVMVYSAAEARRWFDDRMRRTTLPAFFDRSNEGNCFNLAGLLALQEDRAELLYPTILGREIGFGSSEVPGSFLLEADHCRIRVHARQEVLDGDQWVAVALWERPEPILPAPDGEKVDTQELLRRLGLRVVPNKPGSGAFLTLETTGFNVWNGLSMRAVIFSKTSQTSCPSGTALFAVMPGGVSIVFGNTRAQLPFSVDESVNREDRNMSFVFSTPSCRLAITIEKEVLSAGEWTRLSPKSE